MKNKKIKIKAARLYDNIVVSILLVGIIDTLLDLNKGSLNIDDIVIRLTIFFVLLILLKAKLFLKWIANILEYTDEAKLITTSLILLIGSHYLTNKHFIKSVGILVLITGLSSLIIKHIKKKESYDDGKMISDDPNRTSKNELTEEQKEVAEQLDYLIRNSQIKSIGVFGEWGSGKTTVMSSVQKSLANDIDIICVDFEPWRYTSEESLVNGFYKVIGEALEKNIAGPQNSVLTLNELSKPLISKNDRNGLVSFFANIINKILRINSEQPEDYIETTLERSGKKLLVIIDNVERIYKPELIHRALQVSQFLRNTDRCTYVFLSDKSKLYLTTPEHFNGSSDEYLEKFIEIEIHLRNCSIETLAAFINDTLRNRMFMGKIKLNTEILEAISTHRGAIKTCNQFRLNMDRFSHKDKPGKYMINLEDKLSMDVIFIKYFPIYKDIIKNRHKYTDYDDFSQGFEEEKYYTKIKNHIIEITKPYNDSKIILNLLYSIFPEVKNAVTGSRENISYNSLKLNKKIAHRDFLDSYFAKNQAADDYNRQLVDIDEFINNLNFEEVDNTASSKILSNYIINNNFDNFLSLLLSQIKESNLDDANKYLHYILQYYIKTIEKVNRKNDRPIYVLLKSIDNYYVRMSDSDQKDIFITETLNEDLISSSHPSISLRILLTIHPDRENDLVSLKSYTQYNTLKKTTLKQIDKYYLSDKNNVFEESDYGWQFIIYQWMFSINPNGNKILDNTAEKTRRKKVSNYVYSLLDDFKNFMKLLNYTSENTPLEYYHNDTREFYIKGNLDIYDIEKIVQIARKHLDLHPEQSEYINNFIKEATPHIGLEK